jgi:hypothetical protein
MLSLDIRAIAQNRYPQITEIDAVRTDENPDL